MGTPLAFQATCVSTVVAARLIDLAARARWRSFCAIILISTSRPCLLKRPALSASVSGAKPVQPDMPSTSLVFCACACACAGAARPSTHAAASASHFTTDLLISEEKLRCPPALARASAAMMTASVFLSIQVDHGATDAPGRRQHRARKRPRKVVRYKQEQFALQSDILPASVRKNASQRPGRTALPISLPISWA